MLLRTKELLVVTSRKNIRLFCDNISVMHIFTVGMLIRIWHKRISRLAGFPLSHRPFLDYPRVVVFFFFFFCIEHSVAQNAFDSFNENNNANVLFCSHFPGVALDTFENLVVFIYLFIYLFIFIKTPSVGEKQSCNTWTNRCIHNILKSSPV